MPARRPSRAADPHGSLRRNVSRDTLGFVDLPPNLAPTSRQQQVGVSSKSVSEHAFARNTGSDDSGVTLKTTRRWRWMNTPSRSISPWMS